MGDVLTEKQKMLAGEPVLSELFGYETDVYLEPPFWCDYGYNIAWGAHSYANHNLVILDCVPVRVGSEVFIGPNVVISTATHPIDPAVRASGRESAAPITIHDSVWIGAGSVVTRSIPGGCVAVGNPCRVIREL